MKILYRCKLCGCVDYGFQIEVTAAEAIVIAREILAGSHQIRREKIHACEGANYGVAEFIGVMPA